MQCPFCSFGETKVLESRVADNSLRRRRECLECSKRFTTYETIFLNLTVIQKDGREEAFNIQKIARSMEKVLTQKNPSLSLALARNVEQRILNKKVEMIKTTAIGKMVMQELKKADQVAYRRFAAVYKSVHDQRRLEKEIAA